MARAEIGIIGDATATLRSLAGRLGRHNSKRNGRAEAVDANDRSELKFLYKEDGFVPVHFKQGPDGYLYLALQAPTGGQGVPLSAATPGMIVRLLPNATATAGKR